MILAFSLALWIQAGASDPSAGSCKDETCEPAGLLQLMSARDGIEPESAGSTQEEYKATLIQSILDFEWLQDDSKCSPACQKAFGRDISKEEFMEDGLTRKHLEIL